MHIEINDNTSFRQIQEVFSDFYSYLKMEFCRKRHKKYESSEETDLIDPNTSIGDIKQTHVSVVSTGFFLPITKPIRKGTEKIKPVPWQ